MTLKAPISVLITTHNEELNLSGCLASVLPWADQILVLDSGSTDSTPQIAKAAGSEWYEHGPYEGAAKQRNWAFDNLPFRHKWILLLDADERIPPDLAREIVDTVARDGDGNVAFWLNRKFIFYGKWIRRSGWYPSWNIRLFQHGKARHEQRAVGPHLRADGPVGRLKHDMIHEDLRDMDDWIRKHNRYADWEAKEHEARRTGARPVTNLDSAPRAVRMKRWIKERIWPTLPGRAIVLFVYLYVFRLGFLDGRMGFRFCLMHAIFEEFVVMKQWERRHYKAGAPPGGITAPTYFDPTAGYAPGWDKP